MAALKTLALRSGLAAAMLCAAAGACAGATPQAVRAAVDSVVRPLMAAHDIPGMAVAVSIDGQAHVLNYGLASKLDGRPVDDGTLFEIGSISKVFTGTLGAWASIQGGFALSDPAASRASGLHPLIRPSRPPAR
ncbi:serine hydrolase [Orrella sp. JC864]|uniref:serine hydrolase n=1 Tax=Orrella sp. JC864 TaxID=3120298 RepID=UPI00300AD825